MPFDVVRGAWAHKLAAVLASAVLSLCMTSNDAQAVQSLSLAAAIALAQGQRSEQAQAEIARQLASVALLQAGIQRAQLTVEVTYTNRYARLFLPDWRCRDLPSCTIDAHTETLDAAATLNVPIWSGFTLESNWTRARKLEESAEAQKQAVLRQLALDATRA